MKFDNFLNKDVVVKQVKSGLKLNDRQKSNLIGLGLRGMNPHDRCVHAYLLHSNV